MEILTIVVTPGAVTVFDGKVKGAKLKFYAPGLEIYLKGGVSVRRRDIVNYHAFEIAAARHINPRSLYSTGWL